MRQYSYDLQSFADNSNRVYVSPFEVSGIILGLQSRAQPPSSSCFETYYELTSSFGVVELDVLSLMFGHTKPGDLQAISNVVCRLCHLVF